MVCPRPSPPLISNSQPGPIKAEGAGKRGSKPGLEPSQPLVPKSPARGDTTEDMGWKAAMEVFSVDGYMGARVGR